MQNQRNWWENCNLQFSFNYTKYYTSAILSYKSLNYICFWRAWISVNQGFCGQNLNLRATHAHRSEHHLVQPTSCRTGPPPLPHWRCSGRNSNSPRIRPLALRAVVTMRSTGMKPVQQRPCPQLWIYSPWWISIQRCWRIWITHANPFRNHKHNQKPHPQQLRFFCVCPTPVLLIKTLQGYGETVWLGAQIRRLGQRGSAIYSKFPRWSILAHPC